jgi:hypothetical protein
MSQRILARPEQLYAVSWLSQKQRWALGGQFFERIPWDSLGTAHLYAPSVHQLELLLADGVRAGYQILSGYHSDRRGLRGFELAVGAWGWRGKVHGRTLDSWALDVDVNELDDRVLLEAIQEAEVALRAICVRLNQEPTPFRPSGYRWLSALYDRLSSQEEPEGRASVLPDAVAQLARAAHVGGPIAHIQTTLAPFVSLDRRRAYGTAMLQPLPAGAPVSVQLAKRTTASLDRWRPHDLMRATGIAEATVEVDPGPLVPLLPLLRANQRFDRARTLYPIGSFRGAFCLNELAALEASGRGRVTTFHRIYTFQAIEVLAPVIEYLREIGPSLPTAIKRLEHMLYGKCARGLSMSRLGAGPTYRHIIAGDLLDDRSMRRIDGTVQLKQLATRDLPTTSEVRHPVWRAKGRLLPTAEFGTMDRPDRSAWITASNRVALGHIVEQLDEALQPARSGDYIGRIYVDGLEIRARPDQIPEMEGVELRRHGPKMSIYRAGALVATRHDGQVDVEGAGILPRGSSVQELQHALLHAPDPDGGPLASGRIWPPRRDGSDPRLIDLVVSEPPELSIQVAEAMGFGPVHDRPRP